jgi:hypothetical protein
MAMALINTYGQEAEAIARQLASVIGPIVAPHAKAACLVAYVALIANVLNSPSEERAPRAMDPVAMELLRIFLERRHDYPSTPPTIQ